MLITDLGHAALTVHDVDRTLQFYGQLGIREAFRIHGDDGSLLLIYLHIAGDRFIEIFPNGPVPDRERKSSFSHICLLTDDLVGLIAGLREVGIAIERELTTGRSHNLQAWIRDPDGNAIELMQLVEISPQWQVAHGSM